jgi:adenylate kinase
MKNSHYYENHMDRRLDQWNQGNSIEDYRYGVEAGKPKLTTARFYQEKETELLEVDCSIDNYELFEDLRIYIERHGRPYNYLPSLERLNNDRHIYLDQQENDLIKQKECEETAITQKKDKDETRLQKLAEDRFGCIEMHVKDLQGVKEKQSREFLMKNIVPVLSEGLIEITKVAPIDPIDYLADYVFKNSGK